MKVTIVGGGNMGGAIAEGMAEGEYLNPQNITVISKSKKREYKNNLKVVVADYSSLRTADIVILAIKPWLVTDFIKKHCNELENSNQLLLSVAAGIELKDLQLFTNSAKPIFRIMPNTAISQRQSMTFISSLNATEKQRELVFSLFSDLGKVEEIDESVFSAATSISGCGIAFAFRYIRASIEGGVEMGLYPAQAQKAVIQTLRGAIELLEANDSHPEEEIDRVTTPGGLTIKGLNEMEHGGFTSSIIRGLKASR